MRSTVGRFCGFVASLAFSCAFLALLSAPAHAGHENEKHRPKPSHSAPEIDPAGLGAMASMLVGGALLLKGRRSARPIA